MRNALEVDMEPVCMTSQGRNICLPPFALRPPIDFVVEWAFNASVAIDLVLLVEKSVLQFASFRLQVRTEQTANEQIRVVSIIQRLQSP
jgi:hypothetical protein